MNRAYYSDHITDFLYRSVNEILGILSGNSEFSDESQQKEAWKEEIGILKKILCPYNGKIYFEYAIPRMGKRIDVLLVIQSVIFVFEFKVGEKEFLPYAIDQVVDYALDLKNFHETSHDKLIAPFLIATQAKGGSPAIAITAHTDKVLLPILCNSESLAMTIKSVLEFCNHEEVIHVEDWEQGRYHPTPSIIEAAVTLYNNHSVADISRSDASAINLSQTSEKVSEIIQISKEKLEKEFALLRVCRVPEKH